VGIDFPQLSTKIDRITVAETLDAALTEPCERTAINGFGFLQIVTRRQRPSLPELIRGNRTAAHLFALLRRAERHRGAGPMTIVAHPAITSRLAAKPDCLDQLATRSGRTVALRSDPTIDMGGGYVE
jgi:hypothetical protein